MDYEKKYNEALERAKKWEREHPHGYVIKDMMEYIFPELRESEDERIRNNIIVSVKMNGGLTQARKSEIYAYLEKQKEQKFTHHEIDESLQSAVAHQMEDDGDVDDFVRRGIDDIVLKYAELGARWQKEQKPAEWSEEDKEMLAQVFESIRYADDHYKFDGKEVSSTDVKAWLLKSLRPQPIQLKEAYKDGFQTARHATALAFMNYLDENRPEGKMGLSNGECEDIDKAFKEGDWAKIMRYYEKYRPSWKPSEELYYVIRTPQETEKGVWKPSEEQMEALFDSIEWEEERASNIDFILKSLYNDLKKLM